MPTVSLSLESPPLPRSRLRLRGSLRSPLPLRLHDPHWHVLIGRVHTLRTEHCSLPSLELPLGSVVVASVLGRVIGRTWIKFSQKCQKQQIGIGSWIYLRPKSSVACAMFPVLDQLLPVMDTKQAKQLVYCKLSLKYHSCNGLYDLPAVHSW